MTGQHHGRTRVRGNAGPDQPRRPGAQARTSPASPRAAEGRLRHRAHRQMGPRRRRPAESGLPRKHGFDYFFGYLNQHHAHNHFPEFLWRNERKIPLPNDVTPSATRRRLRHRGAALRRRSLSPTRPSSSSPTTRTGPSSSTGAWSSPTPTTSAIAPSATARMSPTTAPTRTRTGRSGQGPGRHDHPARWLRGPPARSPQPARPRRAPS
jgi:hypothetical protein